MRLSSETSVAPYVGAWIETEIQSETWESSNESHPTWVRGLKHYYVTHIALHHRSHPTWVRGLKHGVRQRERRERRVAPYVGAWIETSRARKFQCTLESHPTWVRGLKLMRSRGVETLKRVAPYVGAWIETPRTTREGVPRPSHPTWVRGLKLRKPSTPSCVVPSHPTWVRGLKLLYHR